MSEEKLETAVGTLQDTYRKHRGAGGQFDRIVDARDQVLGRYRPLFAEDPLENVTEKEFRSFLLFDNNQHWSGLHRLGPKICSDMATVREALGMLRDESRTNGERLETATKLVSGMGRGIASAVLLVIWPSECGVWNGVSEQALKQFEIWPRWERGRSLKDQYEHVNYVLNELSSRLSMDLWTVDALLWCAVASTEDETDDLPTTTKDDPTPVMDAPRFGLERHLHEFLRDNWSHTSLHADGWDIYSEPGDELAGYEYACGQAGRIDLLARHRREARWLVIELKRDQSSDETIGQALRYVGWVKEHLADSNDSIEGVIIARDVNIRLRYALDGAPSISVLLYEVDFRLKNAHES